MAFVYDSYVNPIFVSICYFCATKRMVRQVPA